LDLVFSLGLARFSVFSCVSPISSEAADQIMNINQKKDNIARLADARDAMKVFLPRHNSVMILYSIHVCEKFSHPHTNKNSIQFFSLISSPKTFSSDSINVSDCHEITTKEWIRLSDIQKAQKETGVLNVNPSAKRDCQRKENEFSSKHFRRLMEKTQLYRYQLKVRYSVGRQSFERIVFLVSPLLEMSIPSFESFEKKNFFFESETKSMN
jgi:hypothetical protein